MNTLIRSLQQAWRDSPNGDSFASRTDYFCGGNTVPEDVETRLQSLDLNQLEELLEVALTVDAIAQLANYLP